MQLRSPVRARSSYHGLTVLSQDVSCDGGSADIRSCEDCINKNYSLGPEPCYVPGCGKILRKANFAHITFEDLKIEKEVAVRRRIAEMCVS